VGRQQQQHEHSAVPGLLIERAESSIEPAKMGVNRGIQYSKNQREALEFNSRTGQRALAETKTTREFEDGRIHLVSNSVYTN
jgi:hypothetical protein